MKKAFLLASILFISVISTACINNFAVQELNNKAKDFMDKGDYISAIERLKSSIDLDGSVFETQYNLAVAYTKAEDYANAIKTYNEAIKLNPDFPDAYYSLAVCEENLARDIIAGNVKINDDNSIVKVDKDSQEQGADTEGGALSVNASKMLNVLIEDAVSDYQIYLEKVGTTDDRAYIDQKIKELQQLLANSIKK